MVRGKQIRIWQEASRGVYKAIKSRRQILRSMRDGLLKRARKRVKPDQAYKLVTIYKRGPVILREIEILIKIKRDLDSLIKENL